MKTSSFRRGLTLLELLTVMVIIGILVGLLVPATIKVRNRAAESKVRSGRIALRNAILSFHSEYGIWPAKGWNTSSEVIKQLRLKDTRNRLLWEGEDSIKSMKGTDYPVYINPDGNIPIRNDSDDKFDFNQSYTVSFKDIP